MSNISKIQFNYFYFFLLHKIFSFLFHKYYFNFYFIKSFEASTMLNIIFLEKKLIQEKKLKIKKNEKNFVIRSRVKKEHSYKSLNLLLNISEFVSANQKEIYLKNYNRMRMSFFLKNNLILQKKKFIENFYFLKLNKLLNVFFMKAKGTGTIFFVQYRIYGLGFKIKKSSFNCGRSLRFDIGFGHGIYYKLPMQIKCLKRKRRFLLYSTNFCSLIFTKNHIDHLKILNPYKIRGLKDLKHEIKMKKGKKQSKK
jgi:hypothetical protein